MRGLRTAMKNGPRSPQLEKAPTFLAPETSLAEDSVSTDGGGMVQAVMRARGNGRQSFACPPLTSCYAARYGWGTPDLGYLLLKAELTLL